MKYPKSKSPKTFSTKPLLFGFLTCLTVWGGFLFHQQSNQTNQLANSQSGLTPQTAAGFEKTNQLHATGFDRSAVTPTKSLNDINGFQDYFVVAKSPYYQQVSNEFGVVGITKDSKGLLLTHFSGLLVWLQVFTENSQIKTFYAQQYNLRDLSSIVVNSFTYLPKTQQLLVILGEKNLEKQALVLVNFLTGQILPNTTTRPTIIRLLAGINRFYQNDINDIIYATSGMDAAAYTTKTVTIRVRNNSLSLTRFIFNRELGNKPTDLLVSYLPLSATLSFFYFLDVQTNKFYLLLVNQFLQPVITNDRKTFFTVEADYEKPTKPDHLTDQMGLVYHQLTVINREGNNNVTNFTGFAFGEKNKLFRYRYQINNMNFTRHYHFDFNGFANVVNNYFFDPTTRRLFLTFYKSQTGITAGFLDVNNTSVPTLNILHTNVHNTNFDSSKNAYFFKENTWLTPVISNTALSVPNPFFLIDAELKLSAQFFADANNIFFQTVFFNKYRDIDTQIQMEQHRFTNRSAAEINDNELRSLLVFNDNTGINVSIANRQNDIQNGQLRFNFRFSFSNWYALNTTSTFEIPATIRNLYAAKDSYKFSFVTRRTGNVDNDNKFLMQQTLINTLFAHEITQQQAHDFFIHYEIKNRNMQLITIPPSAITLTPIENGARLRVRVVINNGSLPAGVNNQAFEHVFSGFRVIDGYEFNIRNDLFTATYLNTHFASELNKTDFFNLFVDLGENWSNNFNDYQFLVTNVNDLTGSLNVSIRYIGQNINIPNQINRNLFNGPINGFRTIASLFVPKVQSYAYQGPLSAAELLAEYQANPTLSFLGQKITFPNVSDPTALDVQLLAMVTDGNQQTLQLSVEPKLNTQISFHNHTDPKAALLAPITYTTEIANLLKTHFANQNIAYPLVVDVTVNQTELVYEFVWLDQKGVAFAADQNYVIDLKTTSYEGINASMQADQVDLATINKLFAATNFNVATKLIPDVNKGTLTVLLTIDPVLDGFPSNNGSIPNQGTLHKTITIKNFAVPLSHDVQNLIYIFLAIIPTVFAITALTLYVWQQKKHGYKKLHKLAKRKKRIVR